MLYFHRHLAYFGEHALALIIISIVLSSRGLHGSGPGPAWSLGPIFIQLIRAGPDTFPGFFFSYLDQTSFFRVDGTWTSFFSVFCSAEIFRPCPDPTCMKIIDPSVLALAKISKISSGPTIKNTYILKSLLFYNENF